MTESNKSRRIDSFKSTSKVSSPWSLAKSPFSFYSKFQTSLQVGVRRKLSVILYNSWFKNTESLIDIEVFQGCHHPCIFLSVKLDHPKTIYAVYTPIYHLLSNLNKATAIFDIPGGLEPQTFFSSFCLINVCPFSFFLSLSTFCPEFRSLESVQRLAVLLLEM